MKSIIPIVLEVSMIIFSIPTLIVIGISLILSPWGICGDSSNCNIINEIFSGSLNALAIIFFDIIFVFAAVALLLAILFSFKFAKLIKEGVDLETPKSYFVMIIGVFISGLISSSNFFLPYTLKRELNETIYYGFFVIIILVVFISTIYFKKYLNEQSKTKFI